jgi:hypothetical protein
MTALVGGLHLHGRISPRRHQCIAALISGLHLHGSISGVMTALVGGLHLHIRPHRWAAFALQPSSVGYICMAASALVGISALQPSSVGYICMAASVGS